jgi:hypothetical protein
MFPLRYPFDYSDISSALSTLNLNVDLADRSNIIKQKNTLLYTSARIKNQNETLNTITGQEDLNIDFLGVSDEFLLSLSPFLTGNLPNSTHPLVLLEASTLWEQFNSRRSMLETIKSTNEISFNPYGSVYQNSSYSFNCSMSGFIDIPSKEQTFEVNKLLGNRKLRSHKPYLLLSNYQGFINLINYWSDKIQPRENDNFGYYLPFDVRFKVFCKVNTDLIDPYNYKSFVKILEDFCDAVYQKLEMYEVNVQASIIGRVNAIEKELLVIRAIIFLTSFPVLLLAILLLIHSFSVVEPRKRKHVKELKLRGASSEQLSFIFSMEVIVETIALTGGLLAGYLLSSVIVHTSGFLAFEDNNCEVYLSISTIILIGISSLLIFFDLTIIHIISISRENNLTLTSSTEKEEMKWQKNALLWTFIVGGATVWFLITFLENELDEEIFFTHQESTIMFSAFFVATGLILVITKIIPWVLSFASSFLWIRFRSSIILISHSLLQRKTSVSRLITIISFSLLFISISLSIPYSLEKDAIERKCYNTGSDLALTGFNLTDQTLINKLNNFSEFHWTSTAQIYIEAFDNPSKILIINSSSFSQAAFWKSSYEGGHSIDSLLQSCGSGEVLIQESDLDHLGQPLNDLMTITSEQMFDNGSVSTLEESAPLGLSYKFWPSFIENYRGRVSDDYIELRLVIDFSFYFDHIDFFSAIPYLFNPLEEGKILIKLNNYDEKSEAIDKLVNAFSGSGIGIIDALNEFEDVDTNSLLILEDFQFILMTTFNSNSSLFLLTLIMIIFLFNFLILSERKSELGLYKVLGMKKKQLFWLIFLEILLLILLGVIIGNSLGIGLTYLFFHFYRGPKAPPFEVRIPSSILLTINGGIILASLVTVIITMRYLNKQEIGQILRNE